MEIENESGDEKRYTTLAEVVGITRDNIFRPYVKYLFPLAGYAVAVGGAGVERTLKWALTAEGLMYGIGAFGLGAGIEYLSKIINR